MQKLEKIMVLFKLFLFLKYCNNFFLKKFKSVNYNSFFLKKFLIKKIFFLALNTKKLIKKSKLYLKKYKFVNNCFFLKKINKYKKKHFFKKNKKIIYRLKIFSVINKSLSKIKYFFILKNSIIKSLKTDNDYNAFKFFLKYRLKNVFLTSNYLTLLNFKIFNYTYYFYKKKKNIICCILSRKCYFYKFNIYLNKKLVFNFSTYNYKFSNKVIKLKKKKLSFFEKQTKKGISNYKTKLFIRKNKIKTKLVRFKVNFFKKIFKIISFWFIFKWINKFKVDHLYFIIEKKKYSFLKKIHKKVKKKLSRLSVNNYKNFIKPVIKCLKKKNIKFSLKKHLNLSHSKRSEKIKKKRRK